VTGWQAHKAEPVGSNHPTAKRCSGRRGCGVQDAGEGTDFNALRAWRFRSHPLQVDLTQFSQLQTLRDWLA